MHLLSSLMEDYIQDHSENEPELLKALSHETHRTVLQPRMITGHFQGRVLSLISKIVRPKNILEIGTYTGYSALCLAEGLQDGGELNTIDVNEELSDMQRKYFDRSSFGRQIIQHTGDALKIIPTLDKVFDLVFIDAEKKEYPGYFQEVMSKTRSGSVILSDNVLWSGKVLEPVKEKDKTFAD